MLKFFFKREAHLANDQAAKLPVMRDALLRSEEHFKTRFETLIDLDASAPLRSSLDIKKLMKVLLKMIIPISSPQFLLDAILILTS